MHHFLAPRDYPRFLRYLIGSRQIQTVLITHSELGYELLPYLRAHAPDVTYVDYCHIEEESWKGGGYPRMSVDSQELLDLNIVSSRHLAEWMKLRGADADRIRVCHTNVDTERWRPDPEGRAQTRRELGLDESVGLILFAGRLHPQKKPHVLAKTLHRLQQEQVPFVAVLAGDGPERPWLESFVAKRKLSQRVRLLGEVSTERLQELMQAADVFFLPSQWEGIALTLFEAMSSGIPVVASNVGGQSELVTPDCGLLLAPDGQDDEPSQYAEALGQVLRDPQRRQAMGAAARMAHRTALWPRGDGRVHARPPGGSGATAAVSASCPSAHCLAPRCAAQAAECIRLSQWSAHLWAERNGQGVRPQIYRLISRLASPAYRLAGQRGWTWFFVLGEQVKRMLFSQ